MIEEYKKMSFDIRPATLDDVAEITRLHVDSGQNTYPFMPAEGHATRSYAYRYAEWLETPRNPAPAPLILVAMNGPSLIGFCSSSRNDDPDLPQARVEVYGACFRTV